MNILVVVDMQKDFIDGALGTPEAVQIVPYVKEVIQNFEGKVLFTRDTHFANYMDTQEGKNLPVPHCIQGTPGWESRSGAVCSRRRADFSNKPIPDPGRCSLLRRWISFPDSRQHRHRETLQTETPPLSLQ